MSFRSVPVECHEAMEQKHSEDLQKKASCLLWSWAPGPLAQEPQRLRVSGCGQAVQKEQNWMHMRMKSRETRFPASGDASNYSRVL
jgi:hypothetical protein